MPFPNKETQFVPGQSGNPAGYSRGRRQLDDLLELIREKNATRAISAAWLKAILDGDFRHLKEYLDRYDGPSDKVSGAGRSEALGEDINSNLNDIDDPEYQPKPEPRRQAKGRTKKRGKA